MDNNEYKELLEKIGAVIESIGKLTSRISIIETKLEQMFDLRDSVKEMNEKQIKMEKDLDAQFDKIRNLELRNKEIKTWVYGIMATILGGILLTIAKLVIGI